MLITSYAILLLVPHFSTVGQEIVASFRKALLLKATNEILKDTSCYKDETTIKSIFKIFTSILVKSTKSRFGTGLVEMVALLSEIGTVHSTRLLMLSVIIATA